MATEQIHANDTRELTLKVLMYLAKCQDLGLAPQSIAFDTDNDYLYTVKIGTKEVNHEPTAIN